MKPRLLFLCNQAPWLLDGGAAIRNYWIFTALARDFTIELITAHEGASDPPESVRERCADVRNFPPVRGTIARIAAAARAESSLFTAGRASRAMRAHVRARLASGAIDRIHLGHLTLHEAIPRGTTVPVVYDAHNCESALLARRASEESPLMRFALANDALRVRAIERRAIRMARAVTVCSADDLATLAGFAPEIAERASIVPNGVDCATYASVRAEVAPERTVAITGSMDWRPNQLGLWWFVERVLPLLETRIAGDIRVVGRMPNAVAARIDRIPGMRAIQNPRDMRAELARASIVAAPITVSSGTRLRILEAWAAGRPVVTTAAGALGLDARDGHDLLLADEPAAFANAIGSLLDDRELWETIRAGGLERARAYDWLAIGARARAAHAR